MRFAVGSSVTTLSVGVPCHGDVWGDLVDAVPQVPTLTEACAVDSFRQPKSDDGPTGPRANGESSLVGAARRGATEAVRALLDAGATVNVRSESGETALDAATANGQLSAALALVRAGAKVSRTDDGLLRIATLRGDDELVSLILHAGAPPLLSRPSIDNEPPLLADEEERCARVGVPPCSSRSRYSS